MPVYSYLSVVRSLAARIDLSGCWTDTPPVTYEHGGAVLTVAVNLNGKVKGNYTAFNLSFEFWFLRQIRAFVIQTSLGVSDLSMKVRRKAGILVIVINKMTPSCKCPILLCFAHATEVRKVNNTYKKIIIDRHYERGLLAN